MGGGWSLLASCSEKAGSQKGKRRVGEMRTRASLQQRRLCIAGDHLLRCGDHHSLASYVWPSGQGEVQEVAAKKRQCTA